MTPKRPTLHEFGFSKPDDGCEPVLIIDGKPIQRDADVTLPAWTLATWAYDTWLQGRRHREPTH